MGCPQGSVCGPIFWDICIDPCIREFHEMREVHSVVAYVDVIVILVDADSRREIEGKAKNIMIRVKQWWDPRIIPNYLYGLWNS